MSKFKRLLFLSAFFCFLSGCAALDTTFEILDILLPDETQEVEAPTPVCNKANIGVEYKGEKCLEYTDESYHWTNFN